MISASSIIWNQLAFQILFSLWWKLLTLISTSRQRLTWPDKKKELVPMDIALAQSNVQSDEQLICSPMSSSGQRKTNRLIGTIDPCAFWCSVLLSTPVERVRSTVSAAVVAYSQVPPLVGIMESTQGLHCLLT